MNRDRQQKIKTYTIRVAIAIFGSAILGVLALVASGWQDDLGKADVALVLGNQVLPNGTPSPRLEARLDRTVELYRAGYFPMVIASGAKGKEGHDEAVVMKNYLVAQGIPSSQVIVDSQGYTTFASAKNTAAIAKQQKFRSVFVVSQYFHIPRSKLALQRFGIATIYTARAHIIEWRDVYSSVREAIGYIDYSCRDFDR
jgi:vancomycin permeability regulator SanA